VTSYDSVAVLRANHIIVIDCVAGSATETKVGFNLWAHAQGKMPHHSLRTTVWARTPFLWLRMDSCLLVGLLQTIP